MNVDIRNSAANEMPFVIQFASMDDRTMGLNDADVFYRFDPHGFFIAVDGDTIAGTISAVTYDDSFGFIGLHLVMPKYLNSIMEDKLLETAIQKLGDRTIGINCPEARTQYYARYGFKASHKIITYEGTAADINCSMENIVSPFMHPFDMLLEFNKKYFPYETKGLMQAWMPQAGSMLLAKKIDKEYKGCGLFLPCTNGYKIAPLVCADSGTAEELFTALVYHMNGGLRFTVDLPESNKDAVALAEKMKLKKIKENVRMYNKVEPEISIRNIFSYTNNELG